MPEQPILHTERLLLRPLKPSDAPSVAAMVGTKEVADNTLSIPHPYPPGAADRWIAGLPAAWDEHRKVNYAIIRKSGNELVGCISLALVLAHKRAELGYWVGPAYWNAGYATEAARALIAFGFKQLDLHRIEACYYARNEASGRVMRKLGLRHEGMKREETLRNGVFEDVVLYAVLAGEWH